MISWVSNHRFMVNSVFLDIKFTITSLFLMYGIGYISLSHTFIFWYRRKNKESLNSLYFIKGITNTFKIFLKSISHSP